MPQGKVKRSVSDRGFGFIEDDRGDDLFFHHSAVQGATVEELREGQVVEYEAERGPVELCRIAAPLNTNGEISRRTKRVMLSTSQQCPT